MDKEGNLETHEVHDVPTLEQRVANLESVFQQLDIDTKTLGGNYTKVKEAIDRLWTKVFPKRARNCPHCGRQVFGPPGAPCGVCGKKP